MEILTKLIWALLMPIFAVVRWTRDIFFCVILYRLFKNTRGMFIVILAIPLMIYGTMENMKNNGTRKLESRIEYALEHDWQGTKIDVKIPAGQMYGTFSKEEAMAIALRKVEEFNYRAQARANNRREHIYVSPNPIHDQFIKADWEEGGYIKIKNK